METKKIVLIGDAKVGKTTFVRLLLGNAFRNVYTATLGVEVFPIRRGNNVIIFGIVRAKKDGVD